MKLLAAALLLAGCVVPQVSPGGPYAQPPPPPGEAPPPPPAYQPPPPPPAYRPPPPPPPAYQPPPAYPPPAYPPPPAPRRLTRDEAVQRAYFYASQRGLQPVGVREVEREERRWEVKLELAGGGSAKVDIDAWSGAELKFKVKGRRGHHRGHHDEDDD